MNTTVEASAVPFPTGVDLRGEIDKYEKGGYKEPEPEESDVVTPTEKSVRLFVGSLERLSLDVGRRFLSGVVDKQLVSDLKVLGDLMLRINQVNLAAKRLALAEAKESAKRQAAELAPVTARSRAEDVANCKPSKLSSRKPQDSGLHAPSPAADSKKQHPSGLTPKASRLLAPDAAPPANSRKIERLFSKPSRPIALQAAREQISSDPDYPEYVKAKEEGWQPSPMVQESNRRIAEFQKREEEAWLAKPSGSSSVFTLLPGNPAARFVETVDDSKPSQGEILKAIYELDPDFVHFQHEKAYHAAAPQRPATYPGQEAHAADATTEHSGNDPY
jgi:hypothetical protein